MIELVRPEVVSVARIRRIEGTKLVVTNMLDKRIYQFKIILEDTPLPIWRRIQVSQLCTFWDLHIAIQNAMGWQNHHNCQSQSFFHSLGARNFHS